MFPLQPAGGCDILRSQGRADGPALGGTVDAYYWMLGKHVGMVIVDVPDSQPAAAASLTVASSGAITGLESHELFEASELSALAEKARSLRGTYTPPGG